MGRALGHPVAILMPNWLSRERMDIIASLGAEIISLSKEQSGFTGSIELSKVMATTIEVFPVKNLLVSI
ncbi:MAG: hypothetical protein M3N30_03260 [Bacteroidota bacterium]|nr:hypothetical protein [Bacteroidota bacterium]